MIEKFRHVHQHPFTVIACSRRKRFYRPIVWNHLRPIAAAYVNPDALIGRGQSCLRETLASIDRGSRNTRIVVHQIALHEVQRIKSAIGSFSNDHAKLAVPPLIETGSRQLSIWNILLTDQFGQCCAMTPYFISIPSWQTRTFFRMSRFI